jgi:hypothetical protein
MGENTVNSINDSQTAYRVAKIVEGVWWELREHRNWSDSFVLRGLSPLGLATPTHLLVTPEIKQIDWIKYDKRKEWDAKPEYRDVTYLEPIVFLDQINDRDSSLDNVDVIKDTGGTQIFIRNDKAPEYYTSFDNNGHIVFDSYDTNVDSTIQEAKIQAYCAVSSDFVVDDSYVPDMPEEAFPLLFEEAKSVAYVEIKDQANPKAEQKAQRQNRRMSRRDWATAGGIKRRTYGWSARGIRGNSRRSRIQD